MELSALFFINSSCLGVGLAMDAFSVSVVNGLNEPSMNKKKAVKIASVFAFFQFLMPVIGWFLTHTMVTYFLSIQKFIPFISLGLLLIIGGNMIRDSRKEGQLVVAGALFMQGVATSIDALSVGFTIAQYNGFMAMLASAVIAAVTFCICLAGVCLGQKAGCRYADKAGILGGIVLIAIGIEIFLSHLL